jgi:putative metalloenzyme radical SAM/SPASM domain maturase
MTNLRAVSLVDAGLDRVCLSIDSVSPEKFREVRQGGELEGVEKAFAALNHAKILCNRPEVQVGVEFVAMRSNIHELPVALKWAAHRGATYAIVTHVLPYDERHAHEAAFGDCTDEAIALLKKWKKRGELQGIDIGRYYEVRFHRYARNPEEQAIVDLVDGLKSDAEARGILVDVKKLLRLDCGRLDEVAELFDEARNVAAETGIELRLPEVSLREQRKCSFVEEGSAFVSWQGEVSPCYFLWHRFSCFASGWSQSVQPKIFGTLAEKNIVDIWNSAEFRSFRREVLAYDYPTCSSCSLAPCDYVQTEEFEQDCHIRNVPCGSCLWCMGVFQCLR